MEKMRYYTFLHISVSLFLLGILLACQLENEELPPPNILWITSEDNSKHYLKLFDENGVSTPNIESLAEEGLVFTRAFSNAPVCSVARSTLISGCYAPRIGTQFHRKYIPVPMPDSLHMFPWYLREAGYFASNNQKKDYNIIEGEGVWDESSGEATWQNREGDQPFFHVFNIGISHESGLHFSSQEMDSIVTKTSENSFEIQPNHPQTRTFAYTNAYYRDKVRAMDNKVGEVLDELRKDGLMDNTFIFYFGDHGGVLPGSKGYLYETGLHVPLVVHIPKKYRHLVNMPMKTTIQDFVSFVDFGPTVLNLAGIPTPGNMDGKPFLGPKITKNDRNMRNVTFSYADRFDEKYDMVRAVRKGKFKYIRSYTPFNPDGLVNNYRYKQLAYQEWRAMYAVGELNKMQSAFFEPRQPELLFDVEADPFETVNLANQKGYEDVQDDMRQTLDAWVKGMPDLSFFPEHHLIEDAFTDPVIFGKEEQQRIERYMAITDLSLSPFVEVKDQLIAGLQSADPWERYWTIIVSSSFREKAKLLASQIGKLAQSDPELINRVRAAEFLGIVRASSPVEIMTKALYESEKPSEALLILNSIVLMQSSNAAYTFNLDPDKIAMVVVKDSQVKRRLDYLVPQGRHDVPK
ncbi:sulfatase [Ulvibacterium sp.]|uniref:sulfatase family protein n=1 Tax=Ulvibacterium sp. TaxID=2665914 RepID=UPI002638EFBD|nr:sulfatase [Ulvibacterium sp.]